MLLQFMGLMLIVGFGIKIGLFGFHSWLPLAHPVAAVPASALLSGFMVKAGMIGWLKFFPFQQDELATFSDLGLLTIGIGGVGTFYAAIKGMSQKDPKAVLAYSTVSQMGILSACFGVILVFPALRDAMTTAIIFYAIHHGLAKSALFLSVGITPLLNKQSNASAYLRGMTYITMILPTLSLVGAAFTSGFFAKNEVKTLLSDLPYFKYAIIVSALFTGLLMCRFIHMAYYKGQKNSVHDSKPQYPLLVVCLVNTLLVLLAPWYLLNEKYSLTSLLSLVTLNSFISSLIPIFLAVIVYKLLVTFKLDGRVIFSLEAFKLVAINKPFSTNEKPIANIEQEKAVDLGLMAQLKSFINKRLTPQEVMPLNMQSTYVSVVLIGVCILLLVAFSV
jgi:multicomponent K+:H+ antiporter subunit A